MIVDMVKQLVNNYYKVKHIHIHLDMVTDMDMDTDKDMDKVIQLLKQLLHMDKVVIWELLNIEHLNMEETHLMVEVKEDLLAKLLVKEEW